MMKASRKNLYKRAIALLIMAVMSLSALFYSADFTYAEGGSEADKKISVVSKSGRTMTLQWVGPKNIEGRPQTCRLYIDNDITGIEIPFSGDEEFLSYTVNDLEYRSPYIFRVEYYDDSDSPIYKSDDLSVTSAVEPPQRRFLASTTISKPTRLKNNGKNYNLRKYAGETHKGYAIVQGSCVDDRGEYSYYCLINGSTDWGKIVKVRMSDNACMQVSQPYYFHHGNGMCYDSKRNRVVVASYSNYRRTLTFVNPDDLNDIEQKNVVFGSLRDQISGQSLGITALAYNAKYDCYVTMQKSDHNIVIYDAETLKAVAVALTKFDKSHTGIFQSIDADDTYVYFLLSKNGKTQPNNILVAFDWHSENLEKLLNGESDQQIWACGNGDGRHSAVIKIDGAHEIESLFHTDAGDGKGHFYLTNYNNKPTYKTVTKKVKWKKVKKKVKKKYKWKKVYKKVKTKKMVDEDGTVKWEYKKKKVWKYKYKYVTKKVWKYKTKKKKVFSRYDRDSYVLDLGIF